MRWGSETYQQLKSLAKKKYGQSAGNVGDEGGVAPDIQTAEEALELISEAIEKAGYTGKMYIAMDVASSEFYKEEDKKYDLDFKNPDSDKSKWITYEELADMYKKLAEKYPIVRYVSPNRCLISWIFNSSQKVLRTPLPRMIGRHGVTFTRRQIFRSWATTSQVTFFPSLDNSLPKVSNALQSLTRFGLSEQSTLRPATHYF